MNRGLSSLWISESYEWEWVQFAGGVFRWWFMVADVDDSWLF